MTNISMQNEYMNEMTEDSYDKVVRRLKIRKVPWNEMYGACVDFATSGGSRTWEDANNFLSQYGWTYDEYLAYPDGKIVLESIQFARLRK
jgi:hypothetical protein